MMKDFFFHSYYPFSPFSLFVSLWRYIMNRWQVSSNGEDDAVAAAVAAALGSVSSFIFITAACWRLDVSFLGHWKSDRFCRSGDFLTSSLSSILSLSLFPSFPLSLSSIRCATSPFFLSFLYTFFVFVSVFSSFIDRILGTTATSWPPCPFPYYKCVDIDIKRG